MENIPIFRRNSTGDPMTFFLFVFELIYWFFCFHPLNLTALLLNAISVILT